MNLDLSKVINGLQNQLEFSFDYQISDAYLKSIKGVDASVFKIVGEVRRIDDRYDLTLSYSGNMVFECDRCLSKVTLDVENSVERLLVDSEEDQDEIPLKSTILDLVPILEEDITLNLPVQILCHPTCKGICPNCGADLNKETCTCSESKIDPRLEALKNLFT
ncbi:YceD family protein [Fusibacter tunisiensis]|uniref:DUF177 domain-containing protein n=1 Tax=Fusibacter tunisiensis TaxID=1008308 RepID=A0ABS2MME7_9FIRM|nr:DUF177 domain-containing protein [Fusibacter tunisiensis]MBM7560554.1 uncharacterized protein [Fusibacter tunisiensis]